MNDDELLRQMEKLKSQNRRIFGFAVLTVLLFALAWTYDHVGIQNRVKAREFMLLSDSGQTVARLRQEGSGDQPDLLVQEK